MQNSSTDLIHYCTIKVSSSN